MEPRSAASTGLHLEISATLHHSVASLAASLRRLAKSAANRSF